LGSSRRDWKQFKGKIKEKWGKLTDSDLDQIAGKRDQLAGKLQKSMESRKKKRKSNWINSSIPEASVLQT